MDATEVATRAWGMRISLMRVALSILHHTADAEDAVSTAILKAYKSAGKLYGDEKLNAWLMRILVRCCYDQLRRRKREGPADDPAQLDMPALQDTEGSIFEAIRALPEAYQRVLVLFYYEGFKAKEIAHILSVPLGTVLVQLSRGRTKLRELLEKEGVVHNDK